MSFMKDLAIPPLETIDAYKVLDQILAEEGTVNPYTQLLFPEEQTQGSDYQDYTEYYRMNVPNQTTMPTWRNGQSSVLRCPIPNTQD